MGNGAVQPSAAISLRATSGGIHKVLENRPGSLCCRLSENAAGESFVPRARSSRVRWVRARRECRQGWEIEAGASVVEAPNVQIEVRPTNGLPLERLLPALLRIVELHRGWIERSGWVFGRFPHWLIEAGQTESPPLSVPLSFLFTRQRVDVPRAGGLPAITCRRGTR